MGYVLLLRIVIDACMTILLNVGIHQNWFGHAVQYLTIIFS